MNDPERVRGPPDVRARGAHVVHDAVERGAPGTPTAPTSCEASSSPVSTVTAVEARGRERTVDVTRDGKADEERRRQAGEVSRPTSVHSPVAEAR